LKSNHGREGSGHGNVPTFNFCGLYEFAVQFELAQALVSGLVDNEIFPVQDIQKDGHVEVPWALAFLTDLGDFVPSIVEPVNLPIPVSGPEKASVREKGDPLIVFRLEKHVPDGIRPEAWVGSDLDFPLFIGRQKVGGKTWASNENQANKNQPFLHVPLLKRLNSSLDYYTLALEKVFILFCLSGLDLLITKNLTVWSKFLEIRSKFC
jgi:hypothetical protein